jgi:hypothetical protein
MTDDILYNYLLMSLNLNSKLKPIIFNHPKESRFKDLFSNMKIKKKRKTMSVNPKNVMLGIDRRTSIIIKNIPEDITSDQFKSIVMQYNPFIDFFYVPIKIRTRKRLRVAFVNVLNYTQIVPIYMGLIYKSKFVYNSYDIEMEICYSKVQGKNQLIQRFFQEFQFNI